MKTLLQYTISNRDTCQGTLVVVAALAGWIYVATELCAESQRGRSDSYTYRKVRREHPRCSRTTVLSDNGKLEHLPVLAACIPQMHHDVVAEARLILLGHPDRDISRSF